ncbi:hypothetical protein GDO86_005760 [Hymenochirus boettgeri]|nr:hypothetical protein GDO86_005760 [Hymenochirus boettgeri]
MIVNSACSHADITGDGVKSFVMLLCGILRGLRAASDKNRKYGNEKSGHVSKRLSNLLMTFESEVLENIVGKHLSQHFHSVFSGLEAKTCCSKSIQCALYTYFCGRTSQNIQDFISKLVYDFVRMCANNSDCITDTVALISSCFSVLHTDVSGQPIENSRIVTGFVLHRDFSVHCPAGGDRRAVIITEQMHQSLSAPDVDFAVSSDAHLHDCQIYLRQRTEKLIKHLKDMEVKLILSNVKQPEIVLFYARQNGISVVDCLPTEEIEWVSKITGASLLRTANDIYLVQISDTFLTCCQTIMLGSRKYVHITCSSSLSFLPHCVVICSPVRGLTEQLISSFCGAFKMLDQLFQLKTENWKQKTEMNGCCKTSEKDSVKSQGLNCFNCQNNEVYECRMAWGGTFEMLLNHYLHCFAQKCQDTELAIISQVVGDALLCIPRNIYKSKKGNASFPLIYAQLINLLGKKELTEKYPLGFESVSCKYQLVASVLQCVSKLVTIDYIVGIKSPSKDSEDVLT